MLLAHGLLDGTATTITGQTIAETLADGPGRAARRPGRDPRLRSPDARAGSPGGPAWEPRVRRSGRQDRGRRVRAPQRARARVRLRGALPEGDPRPEDPAGRRGRDPLRGPTRRTRHARDALADRRSHRRRAGRLGGAHHRRPVLGRHAWPGGGPCLAGGGRGRADRPGAGRRPRHHRRGGARRGAGGALARDREAPRGVAAARAARRARCARKYARTVSSASLGAVTDLEDAR